mgnify:CR=1 FL=1
MTSKKKKVRVIILSILIMFILILVPILVGCDQAGTTRDNIQKRADMFKVYRKMTFINLQTNTILYTAEGYFSIQTTYENSYQGQQEIGIIFKVGENEYKMDYFSIANNVTYVIEQLENTHTNPYYWEIYIYVPLPTIKGG